ncbi:MAG TPA: glycosyltransferase family 2 protein [Patescibacteria group bacterium]|nr:glycosyltransferase family 2 protein [Patescibacteria group bacterium]
MELSIIIVNFKTDKLVADCVASIKKNTKVKHEVIVIDNSIDNKGFAKANNIGIDKAKGKYVLLLNSDTVVKKNAIDKLLEFAKTKDDAGVIAPKLLNKDGSVQDSVFYFPTIVNAIKEFWFGQKGLFGLYVPKVNEPIEVDAVVGAAFLITPKALEKVGKLNEKYFFYYEDLDYCREIWKSGLKVYYLPDAEVIHLKGASGKSLANEDQQWKRLIPSSKIYNGLVKYYILFFIMWIGQKIGK